MQGQAPQQASQAEQESFPGVRCSARRDWGRWRECQMEVLCPERRGLAECPQGENLLPGMVPPETLCPAPRWRAQR